MRSTSDQPHWIQMIVTMGLSIVGLNIAQLIWGSNTRFIELPMQTHTIRLPGAVVITSTDLVMIACCAIAGFVVYWVLVRSSFGIRFKATAENPALAAYCGIRLNGLLSFAWAVAAGAAVLGALLYSLKTPLDTTITDAGLLAFPAALIGGMDSIGGAFAGAAVLAFAVAVSTTYLGSEAAQPIGFGIALIVLLVRPSGLFGARTVSRV
jgi:branched-chain amino acid transport system permease protein